jgi:Tol biopolymer transport system component
MRGMGDSRVAHPTIPLVRSEKIALLLFDWKWACTRLKVLTDGCEAVELTYKYRAFISYSRADRIWARTLQTRLERYVLPHALRLVKLGLKLDARPLKPVFRDEDELVPGQDLTTRIRCGLEQSQFLLVICSPSAVASEWVNKEILDFIALGRQHEILSIVIDGEPNAAARGLPSNLECLPSALRFQPNITTDGTGRSVATISDRPIEPLWVDWRSESHRDRTMFLRLVAALLSLSSLDELISRDAAFRRRRTVLAALGAATVAAGFAALGVVLALQARSQAIRNSNTLAGLARQAAHDGNWERSARYGLLAMKGAGSPLIGFEARTAEDAMIASLLFNRRLGIPQNIASADEIAVLSRDGSRIAVATAEGRVRLLDGATGLEREKPLAVGKLETLALSRDGKLLATQFGYAKEEDNYSDVQIWDVSSGRHAFKTITVPLADQMEFSPDKKKLAIRETALDGGASVELFDLASGRSSRMTGNAEGIDSIAFSPDGSVFAAAWNEGVQLWNAATNKPIGKMMKVGGDSASRFITLAPDDRTLAVGSGNGSLIMWDYRDQKELSNDNLSGGEIVGTAFSDDGTRLGVQFKSGIVRIFEGKDPASYAVSGTKFMPAGDFAYLVDHKRMVSVFSGTARLWELSGYSRNEDLPGADRRVNANVPRPETEVFSPNGRVIAMLTYSGELVPLDSATFHPVAP